MARYRVVGIREATAEEKAQEDWFVQQVLESPTRLEEAARLLIGLVTGLLTVLFGVLAIDKDPLPVYLRAPLVRELGALAVLALLLGLVAALVVILPRDWKFNPAELSTQTATFQNMVRSKSRALTVATVAFALGIAVLASVLVMALLTMA